MVFMGWGVAQWKSIYPDYKRPGFHTQKRKKGAFLDGCLVPTGATRVSKALSFPCIQQIFTELSGPSLVGTSVSEYRRG
jgi:hypothetical protein